MTETIAYSCVILFSLFQLVVMASIAGAIMQGNSALLGIKEALDKNNELYSKDIDEADKVVLFDDNLQN